MRNILYTILMVTLLTANVCYGWWTPYVSNNSPLATDSISSLTVGPDGKILIGTHGFGLQVKEMDSWFLYDENNTGASINYANSITSNPGTLFVGSASGDLDNQPFGEGLSIQNLTDSTWDELNYGLEISQIITGIQITPEYRAVSTYGGGITIFNDIGWIRYQTSFRTEFTYIDSQQQTFNVQPGTYLLTDYILGLDYDNQDNVLWIATLEGAVSFTGYNWQIYNTGNSVLPINRIQDITVNQHDSSVYFGTFGAGLVKKTGDIWTLYDTGNSSLLSNFIYALEARPDNGDLWLGTDYGLNVITSDNSWISYIPPDSNLVSGNFYSDIAFDSTGNVWVSTFGGGIASKSLTEPQHEDSLYVDVKKIKFLLRSPERNDITWLRAHLEPDVDLIDGDSVSIIISSANGVIYSCENLFDSFSLVSSHGNTNNYYADINGTEITLKYFLNQNKMRLILEDKVNPINQVNLLADVNVRIKLGSYVGYDQVYLESLNPADDPDLNAPDYNDDDMLLSYDYFESMVDIADESNDNMPETISIPINYPNPFNARTRIYFSITQPAHVSLVIYDLLGKVVDRTNRYFETGSHSFGWDGSNLASGTYFYTIQIDRDIYSGRMTLLK